MEKAVLLAKDELVNGTGAGNDFLGWIDLPVNYDKEELVRIEKAAERSSSFAKRTAFSKRFTSSSFTNFSAVE